VEATSAWHSTCTPTLDAAMGALVTGGAGYISSQLVRSLLQNNRQVVVVDDLSSGHRDTLPKGVPLVVANVGDKSTEPL
jgi:UDP-glucose 4-epimerase